MSEQPALYAVVGATGVGKSEFALDLAELLIASGQPAEVVGADAMQLYRGMDIATAKLPVSERRGIPHHLIDVLDPRDDAAVAWYQPETRRVIEDIQRRGAVAILVGGSGLYVSSVLYDFKFPPRDEAVRAQLERELTQLGAGVLYQRLRDQDPQTAARVDPQNPRRIIRALEVLATGSATHGAQLPTEPTLWQPHRSFFLEVPREDLVPRLDARVHHMWDSGLLDEVRELRKHGLEEGTTAPRAIGYAQALAQLDGSMNEAEAIAQTQALTRRYARRQVSWFRRYKDAERVDPRHVRPVDLL